MKEKLDKIYKSKANYYFYIIDLLEKNYIEFTLLNYIIPDDNPGDLDVLINPCDQCKVKKILIENDFNFYCELDHSQLLFNKYIENIGFIQFHVFIGISFQNKVFVKEIPRLNDLQSDINFSFLIFLLESFYRNKFKYDVYKKYIQRTSTKLFEDYILNEFPSTLKVVNRSLKIYRSSNNDNILNLFIKITVNKHRLLIYFLGKFLKKTKRVYNNNDLSILFIGVDGAGKTSLVFELTKVLSKGGIFPNPQYLGLNNSFVSKIGKSINSKKTSNRNGIKTNHKMSILKKFKILLLWVEYNMRFFIKNVGFPNSARSINLIDRSYYDLLFFHRDEISKSLFFKYSFKPTHLVYLTGDSNQIYDRKKEGSLDLHNKKVIFYDYIFDQINLDENKKLKIDTIKNTPLTCAHQVLNHLSL